MTLNLEKFWQLNLCRFSLTLHDLSGGIFSKEIWLNPNDAQKAVLGIRIRIRIRIRKDPNVLKDPNPNPNPNKPFGFGSGSERIRIRILHSKTCLKR